MNLTREQIGRELAEAMPEPVFGWFQELHSVIGDEGMTRFFMGFWGDAEKFVAAAKAVPPPAPSEVTE